MCGVLGIMDCFLLQACVFGNAVQVLWFGKHREKQARPYCSALGLGMLLLLLKPSLLSIVPKTTALRVRE